MTARAGKPRTGRGAFVLFALFAVVVIAAVSVLLVGLVFAAERLAAPWRVAEGARVAKGD